MRIQLAELAKVTSVIVILVTLLGYAALVPLNPVLVTRERTDAKILIDGKQVHFQNGTFAFSPWKSFYLVVIEMPDQRIERRVYPWAGNDAASINVEGDNCSFNIANDKG